MPFAPSMMPADTRPASDTQLVTEAALVERFQQLSPTQQTEVMDFVSFLSLREQDRQLTQVAAQTAIPSFAAVWDNDADAAYDAL